MAQFVLLIAGLLLTAMAQARDVKEAVPSTGQGFLSKYMLAVSQGASTSLNVYPPQGPSRSEYGAVSSAESLQAMEKKQTLKGDQFTSSSHTSAKAHVSDASKSFGRNIIDNEPLIHPAPHLQDPSALTSASGKSAIATKEEEKVAQKLFANYNSTPITLTAIGAGLFALATMLGVRIWRGLRPATVLDLASSGALGSDMFTKMAPGLGDKIMEMKSQGSSINSAARGESISDSRGSEAHADRVLGNLEWDPLELLTSDPTAGLQPAVFTVKSQQVSLHRRMQDEWEPGNLAPRSRHWAMLMDSSDRGWGHGTAVGHDGRGRANRFLARGTALRAVSEDEGRLNSEEQEPTHDRQYADPEEEAERAEENLSPAEMEEYLFTESKKWTPVYGFLILAAILPGLLNPTDPLDRALDLWVGGKP